MSPVRGLERTEGCIDPSETNETVTRNGLTLRSSRAYGSRSGQRGSRSRLEANVVCRWTRRLHPTLACPVDMFVISSVFTVPASRPSRTRLCFRLHAHEQSCLSLPVASRWQSVRVSLDGEHRKCTVETGSACQAHVSKRAFERV